jgi:hypothetical protein
MFDLVYNRRQSDSAYTSSIDAPAMTYLLIETNVITRDYLRFRAVSRTRKM